MSLLAPAVRVGITGELYAAPIGTAAPSDSTTALPAAWKGLGYISDDGVEEVHDDKVEEITAWQNATVVRAVRSQSLMRISATLIEHKGEVLKLFHPGSTIVATGANAWKMDVVPPVSDKREFVVDVIDGTSHLRIFIPNGEVTERDNITYSSGDPVGYKVTITCYPSASGILATKFSDDLYFGYS